MQADRHTACGSDGESGCDVVVGGGGGCVGASSSRHDRRGGTSGGGGGGGGCGSVGVGGGGGSSSSSGVGSVGCVGSGGGSRSGCRSAAGALAVRPKGGVKRSRYALQQSWLHVPHRTAGPKTRMMGRHQCKEALLAILLLPHRADAQEQASEGQLCPCLKHYLVAHVTTVVARNCCAAPEADPDLDITHV